MNHYIFGPSYYVKDNRKLAKKSVKMETTSQDVKTLLGAQKLRLQQLEQSRSNYGKDGPDRKLKCEYFEKRLNALQKWFVDFEKTHNELMEHVTDDDEYVKLDTFEKTKKTYLEFRSELQKKMMELKSTLEQSDGAHGSNSEQNEKHDTSSVVNHFDDESDDDSEDNDGISNDNNDSDENDDDSEPAEVAVFKFQLKELKQTFKEAEKVESGIGLAAAQLKMMETIWNEFRAAYRSIAVSTHRNAVRINFNGLQSNYVKLCGKLNDIANGKKTNKQVSNVLLQQIKIPEFEGKAANWRAFKDIFDEVVHNEEGATNTIKVQVLKTRLKGEAAKLVAHIAPTEANYKTIYKILENR